MARSHRELNKKRWGATRRLVLIRDGYRCKRCGKAGKLEVDHIRPLHKGGEPWALENLQTLCRGCHIAKTAGERTPKKRPGQAAWERLVDGLKGQKE